MAALVQIEVVLATCLLGCVMIGCSNAQPQPASPASVESAPQNPAVAGSNAASDPPGPGQAAADPPSDEQVALGAKVYGEKCLTCHGANGEGTKRGPLVMGKDAIPLNPPAGARTRTTAFKSAKDVFDFVKANMPASKPGTLSDDQYWNVVAFLLKSNGVDFGGRRLDANSASAIIVHPSK